MLFSPSLSPLSLTLSFLSLFALWWGNYKTAPSFAPAADAVSVCVFKSLFISVFVEINLFFFFLFFSSTYFSLFHISSSLFYPPPRPPILPFHHSPVSPSLPSPGPQTYTPAHFPSLLSLPSSSPSSSSL